MLGILYSLNDIAIRAQQLYRRERNQSIKNCIGQASAAATRCLALTLIPLDVVNLKGAGVPESTMRALISEQQKHSGLGSLGANSY